MAHTSEGCVAVDDIHATDRARMVTQWSAVETMLVADGLITCSEECDAADVASAVARFEELTNAGTDLA